MLKPIKSMKIKIIGLLMLCVIYALFLCGFTTNEYADHTESGIVQRTWPDSIYDVVKGHSYLSPIEREVIIEYNKCRTNPRRYAREYLYPFMESIDENNVYVDLNGRRRRTKEGRRVVKEAIDELSKMKGFSLLYPEQCLHDAALYHCQDTGPRGIVGHNSSNGAYFTDRLRRYCNKNGAWSESISYGQNSAQSIVIQLVVDDGVSSRGHRRMFFDKWMKYIGVAFYRHQQYDYMCVIDLCP